MYSHTQIVNSFVDIRHTERQIMSAILEEGIGFGGTDAKNTTWDRIKNKYPVKDPNAPYNTGAANFPSSSQDPFRVELKTPPVNLDPALKELKEKRDSMNIVAQKPTEPKPDCQAVTGEITETEVQEVINELEEECCDNPSGEPFQPVSEKKKSLEETKKMIENFRDKVAKYPKYVSYEGSMVLCVLLSMKAEAHPHISNLPMVDQQLIRSLLSKEFNDQLDYFSVVFDDNKDFVLTFTRRIRQPKDIEIETVTLNMFNSVAHPRPEDLRDAGAGVVPVEKDGDRISVGGKILMNKKGIKRLIGVEPLKRNTVKQQPQDEEDLSPRRQPVAGRNAYEIRADVLQMAIDWASRENVADQFSEADDIVSLAKTFYQFVENKR